MRFLADEGCDMAIVSALRQLGHDVAWVAELAPSTPDAEVLAWGLREKRLILHHDLDFSELIFRDNLPSYGVILVRIPDKQRDLRSLRVQAVLDKYDEAALSGSITRVTLKHIKRTRIDTKSRHLPPLDTYKPPKHNHKAALNGRKPPKSAENRHVNINTAQIPPYEDWKSFAMTFDGESFCREMGIRPTAWYAQQVKRHKQTGSWDLSLLELRLMLYLEANKVKYNGGVVNQARVESLVTAIRDMVN